MLLNEKIFAKYFRLYAATEPAAVL